jgi:DNA helicase-2/ATP-dependent DNA helicase PcrA
MRDHLYDDAFAILYRTNAQSRAFEEALRRKNIPYRVYGGVSFYQRKEVKDYLAYLRLSVNPHDEEALRRVINYPARGIGKTSMEKLTVWAAEAGSSLWDVIQRIAEFPLSGRARQSIEDFVVMIRAFGTMTEKKDAFELAEEIGRSTGILKELYNDKSIEGQSRYENVQELLSSIKEFTENPPEAPEGQDSSDTGLGSYLQNVALLTDMDQDEDEMPRVKLMTVHAAKGLEFPAVFVVGLEENLFPSMMALDSRDGLEEERRLFYVAVTRAEKYLHLSYAGTRFRFGNLIYCEPSRFIEELPPDIVEFKGVKSRKVKTAAERQAERSSQLKKQLDKLREAKKAGYQHQPSDDFRPDNPADMQVGMEVEHPRFGFGKITSMDGPPENRVAHIYFQKAGNKRIMLKYAKLHILRNKQ